MPPRSLCRECMRLDTCALGRAGSLLEAVHEIMALRRFRSVASVFSLGWRRSIMKLAIRFAALLGGAMVMAAIGFGLMPRVAHAAPATQPSVDLGKQKT